MIGYDKKGKRLNGSFDCVADIKLFFLSKVDSLRLSVVGISVVAFIDTLHSLLQGD